MRASMFQVGLILVTLASAPACATRSRVIDDGNGGSGGAGSGGGGQGGAGQGGQGGQGGAGQGGMGGAGGAGGQGGQGGAGQGGMGGTGGAGGGTVACGGFIGGGCGPTEFCDSKDEYACMPDAPGFCMPRPVGACPPDCPQVCGCDGKTYCSMCVANAAGYDAVPGGPCK